MGPAHQTQLSELIVSVDPITHNYLLMGQPNASLPQVIYPESELLSQRRWRYRQVWANQFWCCFIRNHLPGLQTWGKWISDTNNLTSRNTVMIVSHVKATCPGVDGYHLCSVVVKVRDKQYHWGVVWLIRIPPIPNNDSPAAQSTTSRSSTA